MAPPEVVEAVRQDYLSAVRWLHESVLHPWSQQWNTAPSYLSGTYLKRYQEILKLHRMGSAPRYVGVLRCAHELEVRHFSDDGERCLIVDWQSARRMATYHQSTQERLLTQDLGDGTIVYTMAFDKQLRCWKIDAFIQELPANWKSSAQIRNSRLLSAFPPSIGRDS
jgi:hypothetical protein